jgi:hypothetical protein
MAEPSPDRVVVKIIGPFIAAAIVAAIGWLGLTGVLASALTNVVGAVGGLAALAFHLMYKRYVGVLGAGGGRKGSPARDAYDSLRESLSGGNLAARLYVDRLKAFLDAMDRFFGDAGMGDRTLFPHAFGLKAPAPLWTVPSFDRCLLLALIYPMTIIFIIWTMSGHVGPAESALGLNSHLSIGRRGLMAALIALSAFATWRGRRMENLKSLFWVGVAFAGLGAVTYAGALAGAGLAVISLASFGAVVFAFTGALRASIVGGGAFAVTAVVDFVGSSIAGPALGENGGLVVLLLSAAAAAGAFFMLDRWRGFSLLLFPVGMILGCLCEAVLSSDPESWAALGPLLLFLGLLTLLNAPFDWASVGLTRALLRRGLELGGWWPYLLAALDAILAAGIIAVLAITMVVGVQAFDHLASGARRRRSHFAAQPTFRRRCGPSFRARILVALRATAIEHDPKLHQPHDWWRLVSAGGGRDCHYCSWGLCRPARRCHLRSQMDGPRADVSGICRRAPRDCGSGVSGSRRDLLHHALDWPRAARYGTRRGRVRCAGAGAGAVLGWFVVARRAGRMRAAHRLQ